MAEGIKDNGRAPLAQARNVQLSSADTYRSSDLFEAALVPVTSDLLEHSSREDQDDHDYGELLGSPA
jgi:hypothetical protein